MKKIVLSAVFAIILGTAAVSAAGFPDVNSKILNSFKNQFAAATEVEWSAGSDFYKASFLYNNNYVFAYYSAEGEFLATIRNISSVNLPIMLQTSLKNNYEGYWITDLYELTKYNSTSYYITLENGGQKLILKSPGGDDWIIHKKVNKV